MRINVHHKKVEFFGVGNPGSHFRLKRKREIKEFEIKSDTSDSSFSFSKRKFRVYFFGGGSEYWKYNFLYLRTYVEVVQIYRI